MMRTSVFPYREKAHHSHGASYFSRRRRWNRLDAQGDPDRDQQESCLLYQRRCFHESEKGGAGLVDRSVIERLEEMRRRVGKDLCAALVLTNRAGIPLELVASLRRQAHAPDESAEAGVGAEAVEHGLQLQVRHVVRPLGVGLVQPGQGLVAVTQARMDQGDRVG